jgi:class 3 adenylate cyclase
MATEVRGTPSPLIAAQDALEGHRWQEAFDLLSEADRNRPLDPQHLRALAEAAWFTGQADLGVEVKERAFKAHLDRGEVAPAAALAFDVAREYTFKRKMSIASAWAARGERLLKDQPEGFAHGYLALTQSAAAQAAGDVDEAIKLAERAIELGARHGDRDLQAWGLIQQGSLLISRGRTDEGFPLMEEATIAAVNGELGPFASGVAYCSMIAACRDTTDYRRASEWTEAAHRWCERQSINGFPGVCRVHSAEVVALQGALDRAADELQRATRELAGYNATPPLADGFYALGEIRFKLGDLESAQEALRQAHALGRSPHPALALMSLAEGNVRAAAKAITSAIAEQTTDLWARARLLPAQVEIAAAAGDPETARTAADELTSFAEAHGSPVLRATAAESRARALLAEGDADGAVTETRAALRSWQEVGAPYEVAKDRVLLAAALQELDGDDEARLEREAARSEFQRLGAARDAAVVNDLLQVAADRAAGPVKTRKAFVFTDIVSSTSLAEAMGDEAWEHLLRWHDDTLVSLFGRHGGEVVNRTGDGFFAAFDSSMRAIDCAVAIQRALAEHRRTSGFAPSVRVGVHVSEANHRGNDYSGKGVHVAARIAALAEGGQVLVSAETAAELGAGLATSEARRVALRGVTGEVEVVSVAWS